MLRIPCALSYCTWPDGRGRPLNTNDAGAAGMACCARTTPAMPKAAEAVASAPRSCMYHAVCAVMQFHSNRQLKMIRGIRWIGGYVAEHSSPCSCSDYSKLMEYVLTCTATDAGLTAETPRTVTLVRKGHVILALQPLLPEFGMPGQKMTREPCELLPPTPLLVSRTSNAR